VASKSHVLQEASKPDEFKELLSGGDMARHTDPVVILELFGNDSFLEASFLEKIWGFVDRCNPIKSFIVPEHHILSILNLYGCGCLEQH
jgi:hypothetical protein